MADTTQPPGGASAIKIQESDLKGAAPRLNRVVALLQEQVTTTSQAVQNLTTVVTSRGAGGVVTLPTPGTAPTLTDLVPSAALQGTAATVTLTGTQFINPIAVLSDNPGIAITAVTLNSPTSITATFTVATNSQYGTANITVTTSSGTTNPVGFNILEALAPNLAAVTGGIAGYQPFANVTQPVFGGTFTCPADCTLLAYVIIFAVNGTQAIQVSRFTSSSLSNNSIVTYQGDSSEIIQTGASQGGWSLQFICYNHQYTPTPSPLTIGGLVIAAVSVASVSAAETSGARYIDNGGGYHTKVSVTVTLANGQVPQVFTAWLSFDGEATWWWQGWYTATTSPYTAIIDCWLPTNGTQTWGVAAMSGPNNASNPAYTPGATVGSTFQIVPITLASVTAQDNPTLRWQGTDSALHTVVSFMPVQTASFLSVILTAWIDYQDGNGKIWQGWLPMSQAGQTLYIGAQSSANGAPSVDAVHLPTTGSIYPSTVAGTHWTLTVAVGEINAGVGVPASAVTSALFEADILPCLVGDITDATLVADGSGNTIEYIKDSLGNWEWTYNQITWTNPTLAQDPNFWFAFVTWQKGYLNGSTWVPAPDAEGANSFLDGVLTAQGTLLAGATTGPYAIPGAVIELSGGFPPAWSFPPVKNLDGTTNLYVSFRLLVYCVSRLGTNSQGGIGAITLQTGAFGGAGYLILTPVQQAAALDLSQSNPNTLGPALIRTATGIDVGSITNAYLAAASVAAANMAQNAITAANQALAANAVLDSNIAAVNIGKLVAGNVTFSGSIALSMGGGAPVIIMENSGIYLFGVATPGSSYTGYTADAYAVIQYGGITLYSGGNGPSMNLAGGGVTLFSVNGSTSNPYAQVTATNVWLVNGNNTVNISASEILMGTGSNEPWIGISPLNGVQIVSGSYQFQATASALALTSPSGSMQFQDDLADNSSTLTIWRSSSRSTAYIESYVDPENTWIYLYANPYPLGSGSAGLDIIGGHGEITLEVGTGLDGTVIGPALLVNGTQVISTRVTSTPATLEDVIAVLQHHGLSN